MPAYRAGEIIPVIINGSKRIFCSLVGGIQLSTEDALQVQWIPEICHKVLR
jgi:hypothetical protein